MTERRADGLAPRVPSAHHDAERRILQADQRRLRPELVSREIKRQSRLREKNLKDLYRELDRAEITTIGARRAKERADVLFATAERETKRLRLAILAAGGVA